MMLKKLTIKCLAIITAMSMLMGCAQAKTDEEIEKENEAAQKAVDEHIKNSGNIKSGGTLIAKKIGGSADIELPPKSKLVLLTWKGNSLWILTRPFREGEKAETYTYQEDSKWGLIEAKIVIRENE